MSKINFNGYPVRCRIIDVEGREIYPGFTGRTPEVSKPYIVKEGIAEDIDGLVRITLDNGNIIMGYECWWEPI